MRVIKASELGSYAYCHRAWYYQLQGEENQNTEALEAGSQVHARHARDLRLADVFKLLAALALSAALLWLLWRLLA